MVELVTNVYPYDAMMLTITVMLSRVTTLAVRLTTLALTTTIAMMMYLFPSWLPVVAVINKVVILVVIFAIVVGFCKYFSKSSCAFPPS